MRYLKKTAAILLTLVLLAGTVPTPAAAAPPEPLPPAEETAVLPASTEAELPAEELPAEDLPAEELPAEELPAEELPAEELPAEELPAEELPAEELPAEDLPVLFAADPVQSWEQRQAVPYMDPYGNQLTTDFTVSVRVMAAAEGDLALADGWYLAEGSVTFPGGLKVTGDVNLILADGCNLTVQEGILVPVGASLTIWHQSGRSGQLNVTTTREQAAIGGAKGQACGAITVNGGIIRAHVVQPDYEFASVGNGTDRSTSGGPGGPITINDGYVYGSEPYENIPLYVGGKNMSVCVNGGLLVIRTVMGTLSSLPDSTGTVLCEAPKNLGDWSGLLGTMGGADLQGNAVLKYSPPEDYYLHDLVLDRRDSLTLAPGVSFGCRDITVGSESRLEVGEGAELRLEEYFHELTGSGTLDNRGTILRKKYESSEWETLNVQLQPARPGYATMDNVFQNNPSGLPKAQLHPDVGVPVDDVDFHYYRKDGYTDPEVFGALSQPGSYIVEARFPARGDWPETSWSTDFEVMPVGEMSLNGTHFDRDQEISVSFTPSQEARGTDAVLLCGDQRLTEPVPLHSVRPLTLTCPASKLPGGQQSLRVALVGLYGDTLGSVFQEITVENERLNAEYLDPADGTLHTADNVTVAQASQTAEVVWETGWYLVTGSQRFPGVIRISGDVNLILADGAELLAENGVEVESPSSLTIWGQQAGTGKLTATVAVPRIAAGIGSAGSRANGPITINGGVITATGTEYSAGIGGSHSAGQDITINGGTVTATGGDSGAGIGGGGESYDYPEGQRIAINGGTVTATGGNNAAGIGGGPHAQGRFLTVSGGSVTARGGEDGAGIGGGHYGDAKNLTFSGGEIRASTAASTSYNPSTAAGIGSGTNASASDLLFNGGTVIATGGKGGVSIGCGNYGTCERLWITGGVIWAGENQDYEEELLGKGIGGAKDSTVVDLRITGGEVHAYSNLYSDVINSAAIGSGGGSRSSAQVLISGGVVDAYGGKAAAIGGGERASAQVTITGGVVRAQSLDNNRLLGDVIGSGADWESNSVVPGSKITITGGFVTAVSHNDAVGHALGSELSVSGNALIAATNAADLSGVTGGAVLVGGSGQLYGDVTLTDSAVLTNGQSLTVPGGRTLIIPQGVTLTLESGASLVNSGTVQVIPDGRLDRLPGSHYSGPQPEELLVGRVSVTMEDWIEGGTAAEPVIVRDVYGEPTLTYYRLADDQWQPLEGRPTQPGSYKLTASFAATGGYGATSAEDRFQILSLGLLRLTDDYGNERDRFSDYETVHLSVEPLSGLTGGVFRLYLDGQQLGGDHALSQGAFTETISMADLPSQDSYLLELRCLEQGRLLGTRSVPLYNNSYYCTEVPYLSDSGDVWHTPEGQEIHPRMGTYAGETEFNNYQFLLFRGKSQFLGPVIIKGNVTMILEDGADVWMPELILNYNANLTITCQEGGTGRLTVAPAPGFTGSWHAIGGEGFAPSDAAHLTVNGGTILAEGGPNKSHGVGNLSLTVNGGSLTAIGHQGGAGFSGEDVGGTLVLNGGSVTAIGEGINTPGIRAGEHDPLLTVNGGMLTARRGESTDVDIDARVALNGGAVDGILRSGQDSSSWNTLHITNNICTLYGSPILTESLTLPEDTQLTIPAGRKLTVADGAVLTLTRGCVVQNNGEIRLVGSARLEKPGNAVLTGKKPVQVKVGTVSVTHRSWFHGGEAVAPEIQADPYPLSMAQRAYFRSENGVWQPMKQLPTEVGTYKVVVSFPEYRDRTDIYAPVSAEAVFQIYGDFCETDLTKQETFTGVDVLRISIENAAPAARGKQAALYADGERITEFYTLDSTNQEIYELATVLPHAGPVKLELRCLDGETLLGAISKTVTYENRLDPNTRFEYLDENANFHSINSTSSAVYILGPGKVKPLTVSSGVYVVDREQSMLHGLTVSGDVTLILNSKLTVQGGIRVPEGSSLTVYGNYGTLDVSASEPGQAAIGTDRNTASGALNLFGGSIRAVSTGEDGLGVGGSSCAVSVQGCALEARGKGLGISGTLNIGKWGNHPLIDASSYSSQIRLSDLPGILLENGVGAVRQDSFTDVPLSLPVGSSVEVLPGVTLTLGNYLTLTDRSVLSAQLEGVKNLRYLKRQGGTFQQGQPGSASVSMEDWTYGQTPSDPVPVSSTNGTENVTYCYFDSNGKLLGADRPTEAGFYTVEASFPARGEYRETKATAEFEIIRAHIVVSADDQVAFQGDPMPTLTYTVTVSGQAADSSLLTKLPNLWVEGGVIRISGAEAGPNYRLTTQLGTLYRENFFQVFQATGHQVQLQLNSRVPEGRLLLAAYNADGRLLEVLESPAASVNVHPDADNVRAFYLNDSGVPIHRMESLSF